MGEYTVTRPDGSVYEVTADSQEEAGKKLSDRLLKEAKAKGRAELQEAPLWAKPLMAVDDIAKAGVDSYTLGTIPAGLDYMFGGDRKQEVAVARDRLGPYSVPIDMAAGGANPISLARTLGRLGGGKIARGALNLVGSGAQGAIEGGISALAAGESVPGGAGIGLLSGAAGSGASHAMAGLGNRAAKWWKGIDDSLLPANPANLPGKNPSPARRVEKAVMDVENTRQGGTQTQYQDAIAKVNPRGFRPEGKEALGEIVKGDPATRGFKRAGDFVEANTMGASLGAGVGSGDLWAALGTMVGMPALSGALHYTSKQGTKEGVENLRRMLLKHPKYEGILSKTGKDKLSSGIRRTLMEELEEERGY
jgi:hypothetical protein